MTTVYPPPHFPCTASISSQQFLLNLQACPVNTVSGKLRKKLGLNQGFLKLLTVSAGKVLRLGLSCVFWKIQQHSHFDSLGASNNLTRGANQRSPGTVKIS